MERKPVRQWMLLMAWLVFLVIIVVHSGYLCRQLWFIIRQFFPVIGAGMLAFVLNRPYEYVRNFYEKKGKVPKKAARIAGLVTVYLLVIGAVAGGHPFCSAEADRKYPAVCGKSGDVYPGI